MYSVPKAWHIVGAVYVLILILLLLLLPREGPRDGGGSLHLPPGFLW